MSDDDTGQVQARNQRLSLLMTQYVRYDESQDDAVLTALLQAIDLFTVDFPNDLQCLELQALIACDRENWDVARRHLEAALAHGSRNLNVRGDLCYVNMMLRDFTEVVRHAQFNIKQDHGNINDYYRLTTALYALDRVDEAIPILDKCLRDHPDLPLNKDPDFLKKQLKSKARGLPSIMLNTLFKSASMYIVTRLARGLNLPRCYITSAALAGDRIIPSWLELFARGGALAQEHLPPMEDLLNQLSAAGISKLVVHTRDPRQSMISGIHHFQNMFQDETIESIAFTARIPSDYPDWNMAKKIDYYLETHFSEQAHWVGGWQRLAAMPAYRDRIFLTSYEEFHLDNRAYFERLLDFYEISPLNFTWSVLEDDTRKGQLHFRSGMMDEWKSLLSADQVVLCDNIMQEAGVMPAILRR